jgi:hypothetical protein
MSNFKKDDIHFNVTYYVLSEFFVMGMYKFGSEKNLKEE